MNQFAVVLAMALAAMPIARADGIRFLPDDAEIACRAILPQCFTQQGWHRLYLGSHLHSLCMQHRKTSLQQGI